MPDYDSRVEMSIIKLLKGVPLDATYTDTRWFESAGEQQGFFNGFAKHTFNLNTYQRVNNGIAMPRRALTSRVPIDADQAYDCNYIMFQNVGFSDRWWYAFIKQVNYINPNTTEIVYEIDYLQTFLFDFKINESFVEREHASAAENDKPFENLIPEPITIPDYMIDERWTENIEVSTPYILVYFIKADWITALVDLLTDGSAGVINGVYSGVPYFATEASRAGGELVNTILTGLAASRELSERGYTINNLIAGIFMSPVKPQVSSSPEEKVGLNQVKVNVTALNSHTIRNKKLLTYPFQVIKVTSHSGGEKTYKPELCGNEQFSYTVASSYQQKTQRMLIPFHYNNVADENYDECITFEQSVQCLWSADLFGAGLIVGGVKAISQIVQAGIIAATAGGAAGGMVAAETMAGAETAAAAGASETALVPAAGNGALSTSVRKAAITPYQGAGISQGYQNTYTYFSPNGKTITQLSDVAGSLFSGNKTAYVHEEGRQAGDYLGFGLGRFGFDIYRYAPTPEILEQIDEFFDMFGYAVKRYKMPNLKTRAKFNYVKLVSPNITGSVPVGGMSIIKECFARGIRLWHINEIGEYGGSNPPI